CADCDELALDDVKRGDDEGAGCAEGRKSLRHVLMRREISLVQGTLPRPDASIGFQLFSFAILHRSSLRQSSRSSQRSVRTYLVVLVLACLLPGLLGASALFLYQYREG